jgi:adenylate cyclase
MGRRQYLFDVWGDTVNTAARITALADGDTVLMSGAAWSRVREMCAGRSVGAVELRGKGALELFVCSALGQTPETPAFAQRAETYPPG